MSMSISDAGGFTGRIRLRAQQPGVEFTVRSAALVVVASGVGGIDARVDPGLYRIEERAGNAERDAVIALRAGETYRRSDVVLPFPCVAPVTASAAALPGFARAVERASEAAAGAAGDGRTCRHRAFRRRAPAGSRRSAEHGRCRGGGGSLDMAAAARRLRPAIAAFSHR
jgi:hypothetical protein